MYQVGRHVSEILLCTCETAAPAAASVSASHPSGRPANGPCALCPVPCAFCLLPPRLCSPFQGSLSISCLSLGTEYGVRNIHTVPTKYVRDLASCNVWQTRTLDSTRHVILLLPCIVLTCVMYAASIDRNKPHTGLGKRRTLSSVLPRPICRSSYPQIATGGLVCSCLSCN